MANQIGKRYICKKCGTEFVVTRPGEGTLSCCGQPMELKKQFLFRGRCEAQSAEAIPDFSPEVGMFPAMTTGTVAKNYKLSEVSDI